jgi:hypothetical protein
MEKILLVMLAIVMLFNGPVVPGIILVFCPMVLLKLFHNNYKLTKSIIKAISNIPKTVLFYFVLVIILALYSIYVGQFNCENSTLVPLLDRYLKIPKGIFELLTFSLGFPVLLIVIITNRILLKKINNFQAERIKTVFRWAIIFIIIYILLLPLGGYRIYRPYIVRRDTIIPVIIALLFMYGYSSYFLLSYLANKKRIFYGAMLIAATIIYTLSDGTKTKNGNSCERQAFKEIAASKDSVVFLQNFDCTVMSWNKITDPAYSECNASLLYLWHITDRKKLYYQK